MNENYLKDLFIDEVKGSLKGGSGGSTGAALPSGGTDGQVLTRDSNGKAVWKDIPAGGGGVTSWNDLTDRPFYESEGLVLLYNNTITMSDDNVISANGYTFYEKRLDECGFIIEFDKTYTVRFDDEEYVLQSFNMFNSPCIGNTNFPVNNGIPFLIYCMDAENVFVDVYDTQSHTLEIYIEGTIVRKLDFKFIPEEVKSDWNETDETSFSYIRNRPFGLSDMQVLTRIYSGEIDMYGAIHNTTPEGIDDYIKTVEAPNIKRDEEDATYVIKFDGVEYVGLVPYVEYRNLYIGNEGCLPDENNIPFVVEIWEDGVFGLHSTNDRGTHTLEISVYRNEIITLDPKFLPMDDIAEAVLNKLPTWTGGSY